MVGTVLDLQCTHMRKGLSGTLPGMPPSDGHHDGSSTTRHAQQRPWHGTLDRGNGSCPLSIPFCFLAMLDRTVFQPCVVLFNGIAPFQARLLFEPGVWIPTNGVGWLVETFPFEEQAVVDACSTGSSQEARMERGGAFPSVATTTGLDAHRSIHFNSSHPPAPPSSATQVPEPFERKNSLGERCPTVLLECGCEAHLSWRLWTRFGPSRDRKRHRGGVEDACAWHRHVSKRKGKQERFLRACRGRNQPSVQPGWWLLLVHGPRGPGSCNLPGKRGNKQVDGGPSWNPPKHSSKKKPGWEKHWNGRRRRKP
eukprot:scaffold684_cov345-Pavlova_lutheri.AAC.23